MYVPDLSQQNIFTEFPLTLDNQHWHLSKMDLGINILLMVNYNRCIMSQILKNTMHEENMGERLKYVENVPDWISLRLIFL